MSSMSILIFLNLDDEEKVFIRIFRKEFTNDRVKRNSYYKIENWCNFSVKYKMSDIILALKKILTKST